MRTCVAQEIMGPFKMSLDSLISCRESYVERLKTIFIGKLFPSIETFIKTNGHEIKS